MRKQPQVIVAESVEGISLVLHLGKRKYSVTFFSWGRGLCCYITRKLKFSFIQKNHHEAPGKKKETRRNVLLTDHQVKSSVMSNARNMAFKHIFITFWWWLWSNTEYIMNTPYLDGYGGALSIEQTG